MCRLGHPAHRCLGVGGVGGTGRAAVGRGALWPARQPCHAPSLVQGCCSPSICPCRRQPPEPSTCPWQCITHLPHLPSGNRCTPASCPQELVEGPWRQSNLDAGAPSKPLRRLLCRAAGLGAAHAGRCRCMHALPCVALSAWRALGFALMPTLPSCPAPPCLAPPPRLPPVPTRASLHPHAGGSMPAPARSRPSPPRCPPPGARPQAAAC